MSWIPATFMIYILFMAVHHCSLYDAASLWQSLCPQTFPLAGFCLGISAVCVSTLTLQRLVLRVRRELGTKMGRTFDDGGG